MWSLGILIGLPIMAALVLAGIVGAVALFIKATRSAYDRLELRLFGGMVAIVTVILVAIALSPLGFYPYQKDYHYWKPVDGTVASISHRVIADGNGGISQRYVVTLDGSQQQYGIDDTRATLLKKGDQVHLSCIREWEYASNPGWACRWGKS